MAIPVILDVDTGVDDALALLFAARHPDLDLLAVSCVAGNVDVDQVVINTTRVLAAAGAPDVPIGRGADRPLLDPARAARHVHGEDGLGDLNWPPAPVATVGSALDLLRTTLLNAPEPVTVVTLAPMTNLALLLRAYPRCSPASGGSCSWAAARWPATRRPPPSSTSGTTRKRPRSCWTPRRAPTWP